MRNNNHVLNTVAASAADVTLVGSVLTLTRNDAGEKLAINYQLLRRPVAAKQIAVAEVLGVVSLGYTFAANTVYRCVVSQRIGDEVLSREIYLDTTVLTSTALFAAEFIKRVTAYGFKITTTGAATPLTLTAQTGYAIINVVNIIGFTVTVTTAGVYPVNKGSDLIAAGISAAVAGNVYTSYTFEHGEQAEGAIGVETDYRRDVLYLNEGDGDTAALIQRIDRYLAGNDNAGTAYNPEAYSAN